jgi:divinyl chlorophyllide a 8-vinyl-reductase
MLIWNPDTLRYDADATPSHGTHTLIEAYAQWLERGATPARGDHAVF